MGRRRLAVAAGVASVVALVPHGTGASDAPAEAAPPMPEHFPHRSLIVVSRNAPRLGWLNTGGPTTTTEQSAPGRNLAPTGADLGTFEATCYDLRGTTASGAPAGPGSIAVDPSVVRLGTHLEVEGWGSGVADDTGGAIRGRHIDVWLPTASLCRAFGVRHLDVRRAA